MKQRMRKTGLGLLVGAVIVLGGGFASAAYGEGDSAPETTVEVTYTVQTFRAIELSDISAVAFGTVRQGEVAEKNGPTVLYGTTWSDDAIYMYLSDPLQNGVVLKVSAGTPTPPEDGSVTCANEGAGAGLANSNVNVSNTDDTTPTTQTLLYNINNCGAPSYSDAPTSYTAPDRTATTWATASTTFSLDTTAAAQSEDEGAELLYQEVTRVLYFLIDADTTTP